MNKEKIIGKIYPLLELTGPIGSIISSYIADFLTEKEISQINKRIQRLENEIKDFDIFKYKIINRYKVKNLIVRAILEDNEEYFYLVKQVLKEEERLFEEIIDEILKIDTETLEILYKNYWKKSNMQEFEHKDVKELIEQEYETTPDLIFDYGYRVNKELKNRIENVRSLISGNAIDNEIEKLEKPMQKLQTAGLIRYYMYYPNVNDTFFARYLCINFTFAGKVICKLLEKNKENDSRK